MSGCLSLVFLTFHSKMSFKLQLHLHLHLPTHVLQTQHYFLSSNLFPFSHSSPCSFSISLPSHTTTPYCFPPSSTTVDSDMTPDEPPVRMVAIVGHGAVSPLNSASWEQVMLHTVKYSISFPHSYWSCLWTFSLLLSISCFYMRILYCWIIFMCFFCCWEYWNKLKIANEMTLFG